ncbi:GNAT family N-acetyltransferase [Aureivirga marina]|uniref:GNAT family N-acetyltransferase n=1 Tax=Aureivirga marina TaxID=1182451 RepID=UPI0018CBBD25|nr:GNAT family N-acetyltransferase [Aureivirga marina]
MRYKVVLNEEMDKEDRERFIDLVSEEQICRLISNFGWSETEAESITLAGLKHLKKIESMGDLQVLTAVEVKNPENIAGVLVFNLQQDHLDLCSIKYIYVDAKHRKKGIAKILMNKVEDIAKKNDIDKIQLNVFEDNVHAKRYYERIGYHTRHLTMTKNL